MKISTPTSLIAAMLSLASVTLHAANYTWTSNTTALWTSTTDWTPNANAGGPTASDDVVGTPGANLQLNAGTYNINNFTATTTNGSSWSLVSGDSGNSTLNVAGTFTMNSDKLTFVARNPFGNGTLTLNATNIAVVNTTGSFHLGTFGPAGNLDRSVLDAVNVSGSTTVNTGAKLRMNVIDSANLGALTANGTVSLAYISNSNSSRTVTVTSLAGSGTVFGDAQGLNNSATLIINGASTSTFSGLIANGGNSVVSLTKNGSGVQNLTGNNTYTGTTLVNGGTLFVNGNQASATGAVSVASGATLGGSGTIGGATSISGILAPGNSIGTLNITANTTWQGASLASSDTDWKFELGSTNTSDLLNITGSFLKDNASGSVFRFDFLNSSITGNFTLVAWTGSTTFSASDFTYSNLGADKTGTFFISGNQLRFEVVPEPGTWALLATSLTTLLILRRRRR